MNTPPVIRTNALAESGVIASAARVLRAGGLAVVPTDTVYGVAVRWGDARALERLYQAKARDARKPIPCLASGLAAVRAAGVSPSAVEERLMVSLWPGPLTIVLAIGGGTREGFRVPDHGLVCRLAAACGGVMRVTSANVSGEPPALDAADAIRALGDSVDLVLDDGPSRGGVPSTVVRVDDGVIRVLRPGAITPAVLARVGRVPVVDGQDA